MPLFDKASESQNLPSPTLTAGETTAVVRDPLPPRDEVTRRVKNLVDKGNYQKALESIPAANSKPEFRNARAVCLMRMGNFAAAIQVYRTFALTEYSQTIKTNLPEYIKVNFAAALFFGGNPSGGWAALNELADPHDPHDPQVQLVKESCRQWIAGQSFFRRLDWKLNKIAPKQLPAIPGKLIGQFDWEVENREVERVA